MKICRLALVLLLVASFAGTGKIADADDAPPQAVAVQTKSPMALVDLSASDSDKRFSVSGPLVTVSRSTQPALAGVDVTFQPGSGNYPGVTLTPVGGGTWDATGYGHIEAVITNTGTKRTRFCMGVDNPGTWQEGHTDSDVVGLNPGQTGTLKVIFGYSWGLKGYALDPSKLVRVLIFSGKVGDAAESFHLSSVQAAGPAGEVVFVAPNHVAVHPPQGIVFGPGAPFNPAAQLVSKAGATANLTTADKLAIAFTSVGQSVTLKPVAGFWNLNDKLQLTIKIRNCGQTRATPYIQLDSRGGSSPITTTAPLPPGSEQDVVVPFTAPTPWNGIVDPAQDVLEGKGVWGGQPGTGTLYASNVTSGVTFLTDPAAPTANFEVTSIIANMPSTKLPDWLGQRPPVPGEWVKTFDDSFDGSSIDRSKWNIYSPSDYHIGAATHYSKDNVIVQDGKLILRLEKKHGFHNDNPADVENDYATGYSDTFGKWTQRYGYFEARVKLPTQPDLSLAFWMMPDRGLASGLPFNSRTSTKNGGMEFDIMETLSIWGPNRHDFGMHWDDYVHYHKWNGVFTCYSQPDSEGFITVGMLWTPGQVVMYDNGKEAARWESPRVGNVESYFILDLITGGWEADPLDDKTLPAEFTIDYVRAWQRKDLASVADGPKPNAGGPLPPKSL